MPNVEEAKEEIRFALHQLSSQNRHHEFEHLARALARVTVSVNIIPATGPVSAGGDQGRDFETYQSELPGQVQSLGRGMGIQDADGVGFCCTLQQSNVLSKFADDVVSILSQGTTVSFIVAYCEASVPIAARHRFQERMRAQHDVHVEIFDGIAIAELLAQQHTFWIAEQYLHLSARVMPPDPGRPGWYEADLDLTIPSLDTVDSLLSFANTSVSYVGRGNELDELRGFLAAEAPFSWWLWTGPAGVGKSRLAVELCRTH